MFSSEGFEKDRYFASIPMFWTVANNFKGSFVCADYLFDMMTISFLLYQADEFMESPDVVECALEIEARIGAIVAAASADIMARRQERGVTDVT